MNGFSSSVSTTSSQPAPTGICFPLSLSLSLEFSHIKYVCLMLIHLEMLTFLSHFDFIFLGTSAGPSSTSTTQFSHNNSNSNNNNMSSNNLNLTATHNGFGVNHSTINPTHSSHFNSTSVLTYRSNRRSTDRSDNKISDAISTPSTRSTLLCNDPIQEGISQSRSYLNMCMHYLYKILMFIYCGFSKRQPTALNNPTNKLTESLFSRILSIIKSKIVGGDANSYNRSVSNDNGMEQSSYIERIDDERTETNDLLINQSNTAKTMTSLAPTAPITIELPSTGKHFIYRPNEIC